MKRAVIYTDGASSGNPGPSGIGVAIDFQGHSIHIAEHIGSTTNNVAEYSALARGLSEARELGAEAVDVYMDSELVVKQIKGLYKVKNQGLRPIYESVMKLLRSFSKYTVSHVPREKNTVADGLSKIGAKPGAQPVWKSDPPMDSPEGLIRSDTGSGAGGQGNLPF